MLIGMDHYTIVSQDLERTQRFYREVLGLRAGDRPGFRFPGLWLYLDDQALVHVIGAAPARPADGVIDHVALMARGLSEWVARLDAADALYELKRQLGTGTWQLFVRDPDGARLEIAFDRSETLDTLNPPQGDRP